MGDMTQNQIENLLTYSAGAPDRVMSAVRDMFLSLLFTVFLSAIIRYSWFPETGTIVCTHPSDPTTAYLAAHGEYRIWFGRIEITDENGRESNAPAADCYVTRASE